ncbi:hypothetical protein [Paenibacillus periandrae]|uniref:hypothetical protein n=1 Tax=Paenibacillus periandrae TaxID=1761741 RepID=UPI001F09DF54|nr:hypothetical protein [Paenibacillus periandrae]
MKANRWQVYEWIKQSYMFYGVVPTLYQIKRHFGKSLPESELAEGIIEFVLTTRQPVRKWRGKGYTRPRRRGA